MAHDDDDGLLEIRDYLLGATKYRPKVGIICGSGLSGLAESLESPETIHYKDIPNFPQTSIDGHKGELVFGTVDGMHVVALKGRFHSYEGHAIDRVALPGKLIKALGAEYLVVTNAAGGINRGFNVGDLMIISDHIGLPLLAGKHPLVGPNDDRFGGTRFPPMSNAYNKALRNLCCLCAQELGLDFLRTSGVYCFVSGPCYETGAESKMLLHLGADAVGMSTVPEVVAAHHAGLKVLGLSLITNKVILPGDTGPVASHEEVLETVNMRTKDVERLVKTVLQEISKPGFSKRENELMEMNLEQESSATASEVLERIKKIDLHDMTPMQALNELAALKKMVN